MSDSSFPSQGFIGGFKQVAPMVYLCYSSCLDLFLGAREDLGPLCFAVFWFRFFFLILLFSRRASSAASSRFLRPRAPARSSPDSCRRRRATSSRQVSIFFICIDVCMFVYVDIFIFMYLYLQCMYACIRSSRDSCRRRRATSFRHVYI